MACLVFWFGFDVKVRSITFAGLVAAVIEVYAEASLSGPWILGKPHC